MSGSTISQGFAFDRAQFQPFRAGQRLVGEGEHLDCVMVLLLGSASFERWSVEVGEGGSRKYAVMNSERST